MHEIEGSFKAQKERLRRRRALRRRNRVVAAALSVLLVSGGAAILWLGPPRLVPEDAPPGDTTVAEAGASDAAPAPPARPPAFVPALLDLAGDPMSISLGDAGGVKKVRAAPTPPDLGDPRVPDQIQILSDIMIAGSERFMTTLPSTPEDFAFFQAQSARTATAGSADEVAAAAGRVAAGAALGDGLTEVEEIEAEPEPELDPGEAADEVLVPVATQDDYAGADSVPLPDLPADLPSDGDEDFDGASAGLESPVLSDQAPPPVAEEPLPGSPEPPAESPPPSSGDGAPADAAAGPPEGDAGWGDTVGADGAEEPGFEKLRIENNTSVMEAMRDADRYRADDDVLVRIPTSQPVSRVIGEYGFSAEDAGKVAEALKAATGIETLEPGFVVGMRGHRDGPTSPARLVQISVYRAETFLGTIALSDTGEYVEGADPWVKDELFFYSKEEVAETRREYRLLDAVYSTATRNGVPTGVIGEAIMLLSRAHDLQSFATPDQRLVLIYSDTPRDPEKGAGRVLYAAIRGSEKTLDCFVYQAKASGPFSCLSEKDQTQTLMVQNGMVTPTKGVLTSTFGPRKHPIQGRVKMHKGVDWAAPTGTPIMAAFDGTIAFVGDGRGYGNFVRVDHGGGKATGYAHMSRFETGMKPGVKVSAGDVIGYVGTTGLSTGPHLHFELYIGGAPVNPLDGGGGGGGAVASDGGAVDKLVNIIIQVESGGNARAKNPLSSATGLGQFIESTWLRMMKTYRPELARSLSRADLLALRFDPTLSREMVANLAREGESYLRARGHSITAGRLYLAHFLGPGGASTVLSADPSASLATVLGEAVVRANPFLTGKDAAFVVDWAERKMNRKPGRIKGGAAAATRKVVKASPEFLKYRDALAKLVAEVAATL